LHNITNGQNVEDSDMRKCKKSLIWVVAIAMVLLMPSAGLSKVDMHVKEPVNPTGEPSGSNPNPTCEEACYQDSGVLWVISMLPGFGIVGSIAYNAVLIDCLNNCPEEASTGGSTSAATCSRYHCPPVGELPCCSGFTCMGNGQCEQTQPIKSGTGIIIQPR
jgi:hypothetical protein